MDFRPTDDHEMIRRMVRDFAENEAAPSAAERDRDQVQRAEDEHQLGIGRHHPTRYPRRRFGSTTSLPCPAVMAGSDHQSLEVTARPVEGSRSTRRLRKQGLVPGVVYGGGDDPQTFAVDALTLRATLAHAGAVLDLKVDGGKAMPVIVKDVQNHPLRGEAVHLDLLRVDMSKPIHAVVVLDLQGGDESPGVSEGGVLSQETREINIEALPDDIPDSIVHDVSGLEMNATLTLSAVTIPEGVTLLDDPE